MAVKTRYGSQEDMWCAVDEFSPALVGKERWWDMVDTKSNGAKDKREEERIGVRPQQEPLLIFLH